MKKLISSVCAVCTAIGLTLTANAQPTDLRETVSEETTQWGRHIVTSDVLTEQFDPAILPASKQGCDAIYTEDKMIGLVFSVNGELPETVGRFHIHYFQDYSVDGAKYSAFSSDDLGCYVASYDYYQEYLENSFYVCDSVKDERVIMTYMDGSEMELANPDSVVVLMMQYPESVRYNTEAEKTYFLEMEQAFLSSEQFSYLGEARRAEQSYCYNMDGLCITCNDADAAQDLFNSDLLSAYSQKGINVNSDPVQIRVILNTDEARELRAIVRNDPCVVDAQIDYSWEASEDEMDVSSGIFMNVAFGDLNYDEKINVADAVLLARFVAEDETLKSNQIISAVTDYDRNGVVNAADITALLNTLARL